MLRGTPNPPYVAAGTPADNRRRGQRKIRRSTKTKIITKQIWRRNYCAEGSFRAFCIPFYRQTQGEKIMFEITKNDNEALEYYINEGMAYENAEYDFTFEHRFIIYHAPLCNQVRYFALDRKTNLSSEVCRRPSGAFLDYEFKTLIPKILWSIKYTGDRRYLNIMGDDPMEAIDTIFRVILPEYGYAIREEQIKLCKQMYNGLTGKQASICEAEVGTGKSMAYLVAALCARKTCPKKYGISQPVTITTSSIELQNALVDKEIPNLSRMLMEYHFIDEPLNAVLRKGKEHYFCRFRYEDYLTNIGKHPEKYGTQLTYFEKNRFEDKAFDLDKIKMAGALKGRVCVKGNCGHCDYLAECRYKQFTERALGRDRTLDFQVTNHNLYLMSMKSEGLLRKSSLVIIDEAHKFREAAQDSYGESISEKAVTKYLNWTKTQCRAKSNIQKFHKLQDIIAEENSILFDSLRALIHADDMEDSEAGTIIELDNETRSLIASIAEHINVLESNRIANKGRCEVSGQRISRSLLRFCEPSKISTWIDMDENGEVSLCCCPKNIGEILRDKVWNTDRSHVLTSGTMSNGANFDFFKRENGLDRIAKRMVLESSTPSPFDYENHTRLYIPDDIPSPDNDDEEYIRAVADRIVQLVEATNGHTAILFTTYKVLQAVYNLTAKRLSEYDVICMTRSNKTAIADFKRSKNGVLFASGSMWEGVDCVGDMLSSVIVVRLPFPRRCATMEQKKKQCADVASFVQDYAVPEMLIKLRQGAGRLIRCESDTGVLSILDARASKNGSYRNRVLKALEKYPTVESVEEIADFMKTVKAPEYFE